MSVTGDIGAAGIITATGMVLVAGSGLDVGAVGVLTALSLDISTGGIDVDGQSNLDEVAIAGVTTFSALADVNNRLDVVGGANIDQVNVTGIASFKELDVSTGGIDVDGQATLDEVVVAGVSTSLPRQYLIPHTHPLMPTMKFKLALQFNWVKQVSLLPPHSLVLVLHYWC